MKLVKASSENHANDKLAIYAIDGDPHTMWHSQFSTGLAKPPHELIIDLGARYEVSGFRYLARQDDGWNGAFAITEFYLSDSPDKFPKKPVIERTFGKERTSQPTDLEDLAFGRYLKVRVLTEVQGKDWASAADIAVIGVPAK